MNVAITGYYGTGSSAIIDLLSSYKNVGVSVKREYEHYVFLNKSALFDLESRLYSDSSNYLIRDIAINDFIDEMNRQANNDFSWYGSYNVLYGDKFKNLLDEFIDEISYEESKHQFAHSKGIHYSPFKVVLQLGAKILKGAKIYKWGRVFDHDNKTARYLKVNHDEFLNAARKFITGYLNLSKSDKDITLYDHLIVPEQVKLVDKFFDDDFKVIVVDRDPRDIYFSGKYVWSRVCMGMSKMPFSSDVSIFCKEWEMVHKNIGYTSDKLLYVSFDDLVYKFEETKNKILEFLNIDESLKIDGVDNFDPNKSIKNTQIPRLFKEHDDERIYIEEHLNKFIYEYPYSIDSGLDEVFD